MPNRELAGVDILIVEDDGDNRELLSFVLTQAAATVYGASSMAEAMTLAETITPHVLVTDLTLPDGDGVAILAALRACGHSVVGVALTAWARESDQKRTRDAGFAAHINKPVDVFELVTIVTRLALAHRSSLPPSP